MSSMDACLEIGVCISVRVWHGIRVADYARCINTLIAYCAGLVTSVPILTLTAALVSSQLIAWVTGTLVAAQCVDTALLTATVVWLGALIHLWKHKDMLKPFEVAPWLSGLQERPSKTTSEPAWEGHRELRRRREMKRTQLQYFIDKC